MANNSEFNLAYAQEQLRRSRHPLRRWIKHFYTENILRDIKGRTIDLGCGAGQLLARLPQGSLGLEVNPFLVEALQRKGLHVAMYDPAVDDFALRDLETNHFSTMVMAHVLEHFADPASILKKLFCSCARLGIERLVVVVPGAKGYKSDKTHKTFINRSFLERQSLINCEGYSMISSLYFPIDLEWMGNLLIYQEYKFVYGLRPREGCAA